MGREIEVDELTTNEEIVIARYANEPGTQLVRVVKPGSIHHGRLARQVYDPATGTWTHKPIPRPR